MRCSPVDSGLSHRAQEKGAAARDRSPFPLLRSTGGFRGPKSILLKWQRRVLHVIDQIVCPSHISARLRDGIRFLVCRAKKKFVSLSFAVEAAFVVEGAT